jgi:antitoxin (DNA-binding transcriptional repressor) of toxin-antitoxin stability system
MRRYSSTQVRQRFAEMLDAAEQGEAVVIERHRARFVLQLLRKRSRSARRRSAIEYADPAVVGGEWTWTWGRRGVRFSARKRRR